MLYNPEGMSYQCNLTSCDLLLAPLSVFVRFCDNSMGMGGLVSERRAKFGTLKSDCVGEREAKIGSFGSSL